MRHLSVRSVIRKVEVPIEEEAVGGVCDDTTIDCDQDACHDCKQKRHVALLDKLPHKVGSGRLLEKFVVCMLSYVTDFYSQ